MDDRAYERPWEVPLDREIERVMARHWNRPGWGQFFIERVRCHRTWFDKAKALGWSVHDLARKELMVELGNGVVTLLTAEAMVVLQPDGEAVRIRRLGRERMAR
jgi:hypothetical protein